jgi:hypothetical protein
LDILEIIKFGFNEAWDIQLKNAMGEFHQKGKG